MAEYGKTNEPVKAKATPAAPKDSALLNTSKAIEQLLIPGESVIQRGRVAPQLIKYLKWWYVFICVVLAFTIIGLVLVPITIAHWNYLNRIRWYITDKRLIYAHGLIGLKTEEIGFNRIGEANMTQGLFSRIFNTGTVVVNDIGSNKITLEFVDNPLAIKKLLSDKAYEAKQR